MDRNIEFSFREEKMEEWDRLMVGIREKDNKIDSICDKMTRENQVIETVIIYNVLNIDSRKLLYYELNAFALFPVQRYMIVNRKVLFYHHHALSAPLSSS